MRLFARSPYPRSRLAFEAVFCALGLAVLLWAWRADLRYCERHLLPRYCAYEAWEVDLARSYRYLGLAVGLVLLLVVRPIAGRLAGRLPLREAVASAARYGIAVVLACVAAELVLRHRGWPPPPDRSHQIEVRIGQPDPRYGWLFRASTETILQQSGRPVRYDVNADHNRAPSVEDAPDPTKPVILFVGESIIAGHGLEWDETMAARVGKALGLPVVDLGVHGYATEQGFLRLVDALPRYQHPAAVVTFFIEPMLERMSSDDHPHVVFDGSDFTVQPASTFWRGLRLNQVLRRFFPYRGDAVLTRTADALRETDRRVRERGAKSLFVAPQFGPSPRPDGWMIDELLRSQGLAVVDVNFGFRPLPDDVHPDVESTGRLADAVIAALRADLAQR